jgi:hypothetical protein
MTSKRRLWLTLAFVFHSTACAQGESLDVSPASTGDAIAGSSTDGSPFESGAAEADVDPRGSSNRSISDGDAEGKDAAGNDAAPDGHQTPAADGSNTTSPNTSFAADGSMSLAAETGARIDAGAFDAGASDAAPTRPDAGITNPNHASWTAKASGISWCCDSISGAFDGNLGTRWSSGKGQSGDEWFELDMGQAVGISEVWLDAQGGDFPVAYDLSVSIDGTHFTSVATGKGAQLTKIQFPYQSVRYVRIRQTGQDADHWWSIYELTVKG